MNWDDFATWGERISHWARDYHQSLRERPVRAQVAPGDILAQLPTTPPMSGENMEAVFEDFEDIVMPGITHWQHPRFFAYFPANATPPSMLADYLATVIAPQCFGRTRLRPPRWKPACCNGCANRWGLPITLKASFKTAPRPQHWQQS